MSELTKDAFKVLSACYKKYLDAVKSGSDQEDAVEIGNSHSLHKKYLPDMSENDIAKKASELKNANLLAIWVTGNMELKDEGIAYMEQLPKKRLQEALDTIAKFL